MLLKLLLILYVLYCAMNDNVEMSEGMPITAYVVLTPTLRMAVQNI